MGIPFCTICERFHSYERVPCDEVSPRTVLPLGTEATGCLFFKPKQGTEEIAKRWITLAIE